MSDRSRRRGLGLMEQLPDMGFLLDMLGANADRISDREEKEGQVSDADILAGLDLSPHTTAQTKELLYNNFFLGRATNAALLAEVRKGKEVLAELEKAHDECHNNMEQQAREIKRNLEAQLQSSADKLESSTARVANFNNLISEIAAAVFTGRVLTTDEVNVGRTNANNPRFRGATLLPAPTPVATVTPPDAAAAATSKT